MKKLLITFLAAVALTGCYGSLETGQAGLRTNFNGTLDAKVEGEGLYQTIVGHVDKYTMKEVGVELNDLRPKAKDNLSLQDLDLTVFYKVKSPESLRRLSIKRTGQSAEIYSGVYAPAYRFVESVSRSEAADAVSKLDSLTIHTKRDELAKEIKDQVQKSLDGSDPGDFEVTRVVVRQVTTDQAIENSIRNVVTKEKELEASRLAVQIAEQNAAAVAKTANTLTPAFLQHEYNQALLKFAERGGTVILDGSSSGKMINVRP